MVCCLQQRRSEPAKTRCNNIMQGKINNMQVKVDYIVGMMEIDTILSSTDVRFSVEGKMEELLKTVRHQHVFVVLGPVKINDKWYESFFAYEEAPKQWVELTNSLKQQVEYTMD